MSGEDKINNKVQEVKGEVKERVGGATGDEDLQAEGAADKAKSNLKQARRESEGRFQQLSTYPGPPRPDIVSEGAGRRRKPPVPAADPPPADLGRESDHRCSLVRGHARVTPGRTEARSSPSLSPFEVCMIALGLLLLVAAAVVTLVGVLTNSGGAHALNSDFSLLGYHLHGSTGQLLLVGVIVGAAGMLGLNMLLAGIGRGFSRRVSTRRELNQSRHQAGALHEERDAL